MFENTTTTIQKHMPADATQGLVVLVITLVIMWIMLMMARGFYTWFWKTTAITNELKKMNIHVQSLIMVGLNCQTELSNVKSKLERIAEKE
jgi:formate hydrogenlyase subunit 3/multisubunit Na+/H+ antiporter MnhD subunit